MEKIRKAFGAESVIAGTCVAVIANSAPITNVGLPITKESGESVCYSEITPQVVDPKAPEVAADGCHLVVVEKKGEKAGEAPSKSQGD